MCLTVVINISDSNTTVWKELKKKCGWWNKTFNLVNIWHCWLFHLVSYSLIVSGNWTLGQHMGKCTVPTIWQESTSNMCLSNITVMGTHLYIKQTGFWRSEQRKMVRCAVCVCVCEDTVGFINNLCETGEGCINYWIFPPNFFWSHFYQFNGSRHIVWDYRSIYIYIYIYTHTHTQYAIPYCAHNIKVLGTLSWPEDGCMSSRNMLPHTN